MADKAAASVPDITEPIRAYRMWRASHNSGVLLPTWYEYRWHPGRNTAICLRPGNQHDAPHPPHDCGFHACTTPDKLVHRMETRVIRDMASTTFVFGVVNLTGRVAVYQWGYRAEHAEVVELFDGAVAVTSIAERFQVPVTTAPEVVRRFHQALNLRAARAQHRASVDVLPSPPYLRGLERE